MSGSKKDSPTQLQSGLVEILRAGKRDGRRRDRTCDLLRPTASNLLDDVVKEKS